jgi:hypothetical protein
MRQRDLSRAESILSGTLRTVSGMRHAARVRGITDGLFLAIDKGCGDMIVLNDYFAKMLLSLSELRCKVVALTREYSSPNLPLGPRSLCVLSRTFVSSIPSGPSNHVPTSTPCCFR